MHIPDTVSDHVRKRHTDQGVSKRKLARRIIDPALRDLSDAELDDRNARVWATVQMSCQLAAGLEPDSAPVCNGGGRIDKSKPHQLPRGRAYAAARSACARICLERYGIPLARIAELAEATPQWACRVTRGRGSAAQLAAVDRIIETWETHGGAWRVGAVDLVHVRISGQAAAVLSALEPGREPGEILSELIMAAAQAKLQKPHDPTES
jgi:hypothetical protein